MNIVAIQSRLQLNSGGSATVDFSIRNHTAFHVASVCGLALGCRVVRRKSCDGVHVSARMDIGLDFGVDAHGYGRLNAESLPGHWPTSGTVFLPQSPRPHSPTCRI